MNRLFSRTTLLALIFCFVAGAVHGTDGAPASPPAFAGFWDFISRTWSAAAEVWQEAGSSLDPFGSPAASNTDEGSSLDPFGGSGDTSQTDAGSHLDPFGRPTGG